MSTDTTRRDPDVGKGLAALLIGIGASLVLLIVGLTWAAAQRDAAVEVRLRKLAMDRRAAAVERGVLWVSRVKDRLPGDDPFDPAWQEAPSMETEVFPQRDTMPVLASATVETVLLQGLTDGERIAWRLTWPDASADMNVDTGRFSDAAALQFPLTPNAAHTMGDPQHRVQILHWKGLWQKDIDEHFQDVQDLHPNYWTDLYWFAGAGGARPARLPDDFSDPRSHPWLVAYSAGNPLSEFERQTPVEELTAEGFGTLTAHDRSASDGRGVWRDGAWSVVFTRPLHTDDPLDYQHWLGGRGSVGIAIWDGSAGNVGGRKHWSNWIEFEVSP